MILVAINLPLRCTIAIGRPTFRCRFILNTHVIQAKPQEMPEERRVYEELIVSVRMRAKGYSRVESSLRIFDVRLGTSWTHTCLILLSFLLDGQRLIASMPMTRNGIPMDRSRWIVSL